MPKFRKKPVVIEAEQFTGGSGTKGVCRLSCPGFDGDDEPHVHTIHEGQLCAVVPGDWIIPEPDGEHFYPCKPDIFATTYELVDVAMNGAKSELLCQMCDRQYPVWSVTNEIWNAVAHDGEHFLCPTCFINLADLRGVVSHGIWRMRIEDGTSVNPQQRLALLGVRSALLSYQYGNSSPDLAEEIVKTLDGAFPELTQKKEKVGA